MPLRCPKCFSGDFYGIGGIDSAFFTCRECGYTGPFIELDDDSAVTELRKYNNLPAVQYDTTDFSRTGVIALAVLVALFLCLIYLMLGPHP